MMNKKTNTANKKIYDEILELVFKNILVSLRKPLKLKKQEEK